MSPPSEPPGEIMSFGVSPVNYSDSIQIQLFALDDSFLRYSPRGPKHEREVRRL